MSTRREQAVPVLRHTLVHVRALFCLVAYQDHQAKAHRYWGIYWSGRRDSNPRPQPWQGWFRYSLQLSSVVSAYLFPLNPKVIIVICYLGLSRVAYLGDDRVMTERILVMTRAGRVKRLSKRLVDTIPSEEGRFILWDEALPGFGLRVEPSGHKTFVARYRAGGGRAGILRQTTVGRYGTVTLDQARAKAKAILGSAAGGADPLGERRLARQTGLTVAEVCDWYLADAKAGRLIGRRGEPIKATTIAMDASRIETHVKPLIGRKAVGSLAASDLEAMQADIAAGKTAKPEKDQRRKRGGVASGGSGVAARTLGMVGTIFGHAERRGMIPTNPARGTRKLAGARKRARLSLEQIRALGKVMKEASDENGTALAAMRFILLSGLRRAEALSMTDAQIMSAGGVDLPDSKSGPQVRPIGREAIAILKAQATASDDPSGWLFPASRGDGHFIGLPKVLARLCRLADLPPTSIHTLRHTFASIAAELGYSELTIAGLLGHSAGSVTAGYVHLDASLVAAADRVSAVIARALDGNGEAQIISISRM